MAYGDAREGYHRVVSGYARVRFGKNGYKNQPIYKYIPKQQQAAPAPAPQPAAPSYASTMATATSNFNARLAQIQSQYSAQNTALTNQLNEQKAQYKAFEESSNKRISNLSSTIANATSAYDPTEGLETSTNINPALTIQEKSKTLTKGTSRYNRNNLSINNVNV